jgi:enoyl-[acyl-carrier protein] reductase/trans-2-enoyl-CoA reductase (NAD+)
MGGEDWEMWMNLLENENLLSDGIMTLAYDYVGPELTHPIYKNGTIGKAKDHLQQTAKKLNEKLKKLHGQAFLSVNKALITQASAAIPVVPLYISLLYKIMKENGTHEGCIQQISRLFKSKIYPMKVSDHDAEGRVRMDDLEMQNDVQQKIILLWPQITTENLEELTDIKDYVDEFHRLFGFNVPGVDYTKDVDPAMI